MRNFNQDRGSNNRRFNQDRNSSRRNFEDRDSRRPAMHKTICDECGKNCEVPFKPSNNKPVYCSDCFRKDDGYESNRSRGRNFERDNRRDNRRDDRRENRRDNYSEKQMHNAVCDECGNNCEIPFKPMSNKPIYCNDCFSAGKKKNHETNNEEHYKQQFEELNTKLDKIMKVLEILQSKKQYIIEKPSKDNEEKTTPTKKKTETTKKTKTMTTKPKEDKPKTTKAKTTKTKIAKPKATKTKVTKTKAPKEKETKPKTVTKKAKTKKTDKAVKTKK